MITPMKKYRRRALFFLLLGAFGIEAAVVDHKPPASPEVTAAMQPYLDSYKLAGFVSIITEIYSRRAPGTIDQIQRRSYAPALGWSAGGIGEP